MYLIELRKNCKFSFKTIKWLRAFPFFLYRKKKRKINILESEEIFRWFDSNWCVFFFYFQRLRSAQKVKLLCRPAYFLVVWEMQSLLVPCGPWNFRKCRKNTDIRWNFGAGNAALSLIKCWNWIWDLRIEIAVGGRAKIEWNRCNKGNFFFQKKLPRTLAKVFSKMFSFIFDWCNYH